jgi:hypothetical protein
MEYLDFSKREKLKNIDIVNRILKKAGIGYSLLNELKKLMKNGKININNIHKNLYFKEHISGSGFFNVPNQTNTSFDFGVVRGITDICSLKYKFL